MRTSMPARTRHRHAIAPAVAGLTIAVLLSACGSTLSARGTNGGGTLLEPSSSPGSSVGTLGGTAAGAASPGSAPGSTAGSSGAAGTGGSLASAGTTAGSYPTADGSGGGTGSGGALPQQTGDGPGVTATTINIAEAYSPAAAAEDSALGAANDNPGNTQAEESAVIAYINAHGGIAGRHAVTIPYKIDSTASADETDEAACADWTQDHKTFVLESLSDTPIIDQCAASQHVISVSAGDITFATSADQAQFPQAINLDGMTNDRAMKVTIEGLARQGYFAKGSKVGVVTWDDPNFTYAIAHGAEPALSALGITNEKIAYVASPQSYGDLGATSSSTSSALLQFHEEGINRVILFDGATGVASAGILVLEWMQQANTQDYTPIYGLNSTSGFSAATSDYPTRQMQGSLGVGWVPTLDETASDYPTSASPSSAKICLQIMHQAGQTITAGNDAGIALSICDQLFFLKFALAKLTGPLNQTNALEAINAVGTSYQSQVTFGVDINATQHDAVRLVRSMDFVSSCTCYRYTGAAYDPGG